MPPRPPTSSFVIDRSDLKGYDWIQHLMNANKQPPFTTFATKSNVSSRPAVGVIESKQVNRSTTVGDEGRKAAEEVSIPNPAVTRKYLIADLVDICSGFAPIPEEEMFLGGPLKKRYYAEQRLLSSLDSSPLFV